MEQYALLFLIVLGVNLLPAFGPPTWSAFSTESITISGIPSGT